MRDSHLIELEFNGKEDSKNRGVCLYAPLINQSNQTLYMKITRQSQLTGISRTMDIPITREQLDKYYKDKMLIQHAFPNLDVNQKEFILTGITPEEWDSMFKEEE